MKKFLLFAGETYYPLGGWEDLRGDFDSIEDARDKLSGHDDWYQIVDRHSGKVMKAMWRSVNGWIDKTKDFK